MDEKIPNTKLINYFEIKPIEGKCMYTTFIPSVHSSTRRHGNFAGVHTLLRILLSSNSAVLINIITGVLPPHFDFVVYYVLCQC
jgi:hypothetical protein